jgi:hypothetical protein
MHDGRPGRAVSTDISDYSVHRDSLSEFDSYTGRRAESSQFCIDFQWLIECVKATASPRRSSVAKTKSSPLTRSRDLCVPA